MLKMHEENNVTPYFYNNFRSHCQFRILKLLSAARPSLTFQISSVCQIRVGHIICQAVVIITRVVDVFGNVN